MAVFEFDSELEDFVSQKAFYFEWDLGNYKKSYIKHRIRKEESEEVFFDEDVLILGKQIFPDHPENRSGLIGKTFSQKILFISFTIRGSKVRIISARKANKKERLLYEKE